MTCVDTDDHSSCGQLLDHRDDAPKFLVDGDRGSTRSCRFPADVNDPSTAVHHLDTSRHRTVGGEVSTAIGERIRRHVEHSHQDRGIELESSVAELEVHPLSMPWPGALTERCSVSATLR